MKQLIFLFFLIPSLICVAVTKEEMEKARAITAKQYLRYANNGSDYLDKLEVSSLSELEGKLKAKEKENIASFKKVSIPSDYASWDKERLVQYWSSDFFKSSGLIEKGKESRASVKRKIGEMKVSDPASEPTPEASSAEEPVPQIAPEDQQPAPSVDAALQVAEDSIAAHAETVEEENRVEKSDGGTTIYIVILVLLILVVIGLVVYASKIFKSSGLKDDRRGEIEDLRRREEDYRRADMQRSGEHKRALESMSDSLAEKENEIRSLRVRCESAARRERDLRDEIDRISHENELLRDEVATLRSVQRAPVPEDRIIRETPVPRQRVKDNAPVRGKKEIFLSRAGADGFFLRSDSKFIPGVTVFSLITTDGITGTFDIVDDGDVIEAVLSSPRKTISNAVNAEIPADPDEVTGIQTDSAGTAVNEDGEWRVVRKARIHFC